ncbi:hypothetical protein [uncultured Shewanella sp.]|uniref:hypothetical protein n=1 Tax=uncultured Shewanella sp. TaxID=173975 RepID=UPI00260251B3|nr:hypothetical protein [uncultured Shewanella sp.]
MKALFLLSILLFSLPFIMMQAFAKEEGGASYPSPNNLVLVTIDGLRWNEIIDGADLKLINSPHWVLDPQQIKRDFWQDNRHARREKLMPFLWQTMVSQGVLIGTGHDYIVHSDREEKCHRAPAIDACKVKSNPKRPKTELSKSEEPQIEASSVSPNTDMMQWLRSVFPYGYRSTPFGVKLVPVYFNDVDKQKPNYWKKTNFDSKTYAYAVESIKSHFQKVTYLSFGATDMHLHEGNYGKYLYAARRIDSYIARLWALLQSLPQYKNNTILVVVNGHHLKRVSRTATEKTINGYYPLWFVAMGPNIRPVGELNEHFPISPADISQILLTLLNEYPELTPPRLNKLLDHFMQQKTPAK